MLKSTIILDNSIVNENSNPEFWIDSNEPLSFFDYVKNVKTVYTPVEFNDYYSEYLHQWYEIKGRASSDISSAVRDKYVELLRDIALNYSSAEEQRFLSNIDFSDPQDMAIAIPFYSSKIAEICQFYTKKREKVQYKIEDNKIKGTITSIEKNIYNSIVDYIFIDDNELPYSSIESSLSAVTDNLEIEIEEYFDTYSTYFNIDDSKDISDYPDGGALRALYYTNNFIDSVNNVEDLFINFDSALRSEIFNKPFSLSGTNNFLSFNLPKNINSQADTIRNIIDQKEDSTTLKIELKKKLYEKYIGTDIYYLSTNSTGTEYLSGVLFRAENPSSNLLNTRFASIASTPSDQLRTLRDIGLFFIPDKLGMLYFKTPKNTFSVRQESLQPDKVYVFPDPNVYGNVGNVTEEIIDYPLFFIVDNSPLVKNSSYGFAINDVYSTSYDQLFYAYSSYQELYNAQTKNLSGFDKFNLLVNRGVITDWHQDIFGNQYGLVKNIHSNRKNIQSIDSDIDTSKKALNYLVLDGYLFKDANEGFNFNYEISDGLTFNNSLRTGVTARTIDEIYSGSFSTGYGFASGEMFDLSGSPIRSIYLREFAPYIDAIYPESFQSSIVNGEIYDGGIFINSDGTILTDPIPADNEAFNTSLNTYYTTLIECGLDLPLTLGAVPSSDGSFLPEFPLSAAITEINDGGSFRTTIEIVNDYPFLNDQLNYYNRPNANSSTLFDTNTGDYIENESEIIDSLQGSIFVYNNLSNTILPISSAMVKTFTNLPSLVREEIYNDTKWINTLYDTIFIDTSNYYVIQKIAFEDGIFINTSEPNLYFEKYNNNYESFSKPFHVERDNICLFCKMTLLTAGSGLNAKTIYPEIYRYNISDHKTKKIFPATVDDQLTSIFTLSGLGDINILKVKQPDIVYNSRNNIISVTTVYEDGNSAGYILNAKFRYSLLDSIENISAKIYKLNSNGTTYNFTQSLSAGFVESYLIADTFNQDTVTGIFYFN